MARTPALLLYLLRLFRRGLIFLFHPHLGLLSYRHGAWRCAPRKGSLGHLSLYLAGKATLYRLPARLALLFPGHTFALAK